MSIRPRIQLLPFATATLLLTFAIHTLPAVAHDEHFSFNGTISNVTGNFAGTAWSGVQIGDPFTIEMTFDGHTLDSHPDATRGTYAQAITAYSLQIGTASDSNLTFNGTINVWNNNPTEDDQFDASAFLSNNVSALLVFEDPTRTALTTAALPSSLNLGAFSVRSFSISVPGGGGIGGPVAVPEPAGAMLAVSSLFGLAFRRRAR
jgi:hypothetical protein